MSWLSRLNPRPPGGRSSQKMAAPAPVTADPETCLMVFENHWRQVSWVLDQCGDPGLAGVDDLTAVRNHTDQMLCLLAEERPGVVADGGAECMGPILELVVTQDILERLVQWYLRRGLDVDSQGALLKLFEMLISRSQQPLLQHRAVLHPLLSLLGVCANPPTGCPLVLEGSLVLLLHQVCVCLARQPPMLELLFQTAAPQGATNLLIFSLLVPFIHREGPLGQQARDALLLVMATSAGSDAVARYIVENSYFCPVLATGLSALYSSLPRKIEVRGDDWHALRREDWVGVSSLVLFMNSLEFCNAVVQVAHPLVRGQLLDYVHNGFLVPVMGPALHKVTRDASSVEEMIASTAYLDLFLRSVTETTLLKTFLRFLLLHRHDNDAILDTLLMRINSNSRLCMVSLSLFRTLLSLNCEDLMLQLVLRYLLPCTHVMLSQRRAIREADLYGKSAHKFLSLIPECCRLDTAPPGDQDEDSALWGKGPSSPSTESPVHSKPSTPSRLALFIRQQGGGGGVSSQPGQEVPPPSPESPAHQVGEGRDWESGYLEYLHEARRGIELCAWACRDWSAPYDGEDPSPHSAPCPPPPPAEPVPPPSQQRAAAARLDWGASDRDSGEWDITISKNCISLTPRSKKRTLQREELPLDAPPMPVLPPPPPVAHQGASEALYNGTGQDGGMEVKKVRRDLCLGVHAAPQGGYTEPPPLQEVSAPPAASSDSRDTGPPDLAAGRGLESVESLIEELLERVPAGDGRGISIEAFNQELRELEDRVQDGRVQDGRVQDGRVQDGRVQDGRVQDGRVDAPAARVRTPSPTESELSVTEPRPEGTGAGGFGSPRLTGQPPSQPYTGPFVAVLFTKLENMLQNSLYVNILLTGIVAQLASYPQPLLRSFLLNTNMVFQPSVKSLIQVLGSVKNRIESFAAAQEDFPGMLRKARRYLAARGKLDWSDSPISVPSLRRSDSLVKSRKPSLGDLILRHTNSPTRARQAAQLALAHVRDGGQSLHSALFRGSAGHGSGIEKQAEALRVKNAVYCAVIFPEFLKELAALAQEHAVAMPFPRSQGAEE
nr:FTS and Hook-interacting protein isoform X1 [Paramormyrops kingsleyae]